MSSSAIRIYTDGSCSPNPGPGGWGAVLLFADGEKVVELQGGEESATNNRMELLAAIQALQTLEAGSSVEVYTDSKYLQRGIFEWLKKWQNNGWRTAEGGEVKNKDLWKLLAAQLKRHKISWVWLKGHAGDRWNERADLLAAEARGSLKTVAEPVDPRGVHFYPAVTWKNGSGAGGWAVILNYQGYYKVLGGYEQKTTANRLYLLAVIRGLQHLKRSLPVYIHTRSGYLRDGLETWLDGWRRRSWQTKDGGKVSNVQEWRQLADFKKKFHLRVISESAEEQRCHTQEAKVIAREFGEILEVAEPF